MAVEAAEKLANLKDHHYHRHSSSNKTSRRESYHGTKSSKNAQTSTSFGTTTSKKTTSVPGEDIVTMISKAESNIPELLSAVRAAACGRVSSVVVYSRVSLCVCMRLGCVCVLPRRGNDDAGREGWQGCTCAVHAQRVIQGAQRSYGHGRRVCVCACAACAHTPPQRARRASWTST